MAKIKPQTPIAMTTQLTVLLMHAMDHKIKILKVSAHNNKIVLTVKDHKTGFRFYCGLTNLELLVGWHYKIVQNTNGNCSMGFTPIKNVKGE